MKKTLTSIRIDQELYEGIEANRFGVPRGTFIKNYLMKGIAPVQPKKVEIKKEDK